MYGTRGGKRRRHKLAPVLGVQYSTTHRETETHNGNVSCSVKEYRLHILSTCGIIVNIQLPRWTFHNVGSVWEAKLQSASLH